LLDVERGRPQDALLRASEALGYAELLERDTEIMLAHVALALAHRASNDSAGYQKHLAAIADFEQTSVARWARNRAASLMTADT
jgi:hypothetical protein